MNKLIIVIFVLCLSYEAHCKIDFSIEECAEYYEPPMIALKNYSKNHLDKEISFFELNYKDYIIQLCFHSKYDDESYMGNYCYEIRYFLKKDNIRSIESIHNLIKQNLGEIELASGQDIAMKNKRLFRVVEHFETEEPLFIDFNDEEYLDIDPVTEIHSLDGFNLIKNDSLLKAPIDPRDMLIKGFRYQVKDSDIKSDWVQCEFTGNYNILIIRDMERYKEIKNKNVPELIEREIRKINIKNDQKVPKNSKK